MTSEIIGTVLINKHIYNIVRGRYPANNAISVVLYDVNGRPYAKFSTNVVDAQDIKEDEFCVKVWSENAHIVAPMLATGLFEQTDKSARTGYVVAPIWRIKK